MRTTALFVALGTAIGCTSPIDAPRPASPFSAERVVDDDSHIVVMEYEAWFGPNAVTFQGAAARPVLHSPDMDALGGGYDSADPQVIARHVAWMERIGVDAALVDLTNNVSCIFDSDAFVARYLENFNGCPTFRHDYQQIRDNTGNLYGAWSKLSTHLAIIPLVGAIDQNVFLRDIDGKTAFEKEIAYFGALMRAHRERNVIYRGKPLIVVYLGAAQDPNRADRPLWAQVERFLETHPDIAGQYTFRLMAGFLDAQPALWEKPGATTQGPVRINPAYGFWSWVDRLDHPTYNRAGERVENLTVSIATMGQNGWGSPDDAPRFGPNKTYATLGAFMAYARRLRPTFLIIHQFNEFVPPDEGFDANTDDDIEPADLWGTSALEAVERELEAGQVKTRP